MMDEDYMMGSLLLTLFHYALFVFSFEIFLPVEIKSKFFFWFVFLLFALATFFQTWICNYRLLNLIYENEVVKTK